MLSGSQDLYQSEQLKTIEAGDREQVRLERIESNDQARLNKKAANEAKAVDAENTMLRIKRKREEDNRTFDLEHKAKEQELEQQRLVKELDLEQRRIKIKLDQQAREAEIRIAEAEA